MRARDENMSSRVFLSDGCRVAFGYYSQDGMPTTEIGHSQIVKITVSDVLLTISLAGGVVELEDVGQDCCEYRHMKTDDDVESHIGAALKNIEVRDGPTVSDNDYGDITECQFLLVTTSQGVFTMANYNEHNGYYGEFNLVCRFISKDSKS